MKLVTKILSLGIIFLFVSTLQLSAQKCKYDYNKTDPITGETTKKTSFSILPKGTTFGKMSFHKIGTTYHFQMDISCTGELKEIVEKGDKITLKLSNGEIITFTSQDDIKPVYNVSPGLVVTSRYTVAYDIDVESLQQITEFLPTFIRINIGTKVYDEQIASGIGKKIAQAAECIL